MPVNLLLPQQAVIKDRIPEAEVVFSLRLALQDGAFDFRPGQFTMMGLPGIGEAPFSFSSLPMDGGKSFMHTVHIVGNVTTALDKLAKNDSVQIRGPFGNGWPLDRVKGRDVIVAAGGVGLATLRPLIKYLDRMRGKNRMFVLYGIRRMADLLFRNDLLDWMERGKLNVLVACQEAALKSDIEVRKCLVTGLLDSVTIPVKGAVSFVCGPDKMMGAMARELVRRGQDPGDIYVSLETKMECGIGHCGHCQVGPHFVCKDGPVFAYRDVAQALDTPL